VGRRTRVVATVLAVALVASLVTAFALRITRTSADVSPSGRPPTTVAGVVFCRAPLEVAGYQNEGGAHVVYPFMHPERPSFGEAPARCFRSLEQAQRADYALAPLPPGVQHVGGIYLVAATRDLRARCRSADRQLSFVAPCPELVPSRIAWGCKPCLMANSFVLEGEADAPQDYRGKFEENAIHFVVAASRDRNASPLTCIGGSAQGELEVGDRRVELLRCPDGSTLHSGHLLARWERSGVQYAVSLHGSDTRNRALLPVLVAAVRQGR
jgi:hypothetical protein